MLKTIEIAVMIGVSAFLAATVADQVGQVITEKMAIVTQALHSVQVQTAHH